MEEERARRLTDFVAGDVVTAEDTTACGDLVGSLDDGGSKDADGGEGDSNKGGEVHCDVMGNSICVVKRDGKGV
jgi:hypothetical protein